MLKLCKTCALVLMNSLDRLFKLTGDADAEWKYKLSKCGRTKVQSGDCLERINKVFLPKFRNQEKDANE